jgi:spoIIIJ-associated protein
LDAGAAPAAPASNGKRPNRRSNGPKAEPTEKENTTVTETVDVDLAEHSRIVTEFLDGLVDSFDLEGRVEAVSIDEETTEVRVEGRDLGILVGPKGNTLAAIQELSRTVIHRKVSGTAAGRVRLDVAGYRQRRREALEQFTRGVAEEVRSSGVQKALEPMGSADRKVVHDAVNEIEGVSTISEGDEPRRRVVLIPS